MEAIPYTTATEMIQSHTSSGDRDWPATLFDPFFLPTHPDTLYASVVTQMSDHLTTLYAITCASESQATDCPEKTLTRVSETTFIGEFSISGTKSRWECGRESCNHTTIVEQEDDKAPTQSTRSESHDDCYWLSHLALGYVTAGLEKLTPFHDPLPERRDVAGTLEPDDWSLSSSQLLSAMNCTATPTTESSAGSGLHSGFEAINTGDTVGDASRTASTRVAETDTAPKGVAERTHLSKKIAIFGLSVCLLSVVL